MKSEHPYPSRDCLVHVRSRYPSLFKAQQKVAVYVLKNPERVINMSISEVSKESGVADSTVVRFCQDLGYKGYQEFKVNLAKSLVLPEHYIHEDISLEDDTDTIIDKLISSDINGLKDTKRVLEREEVEKAVDAMVQARRIEFYAVGSSSPIALDAYFRFLKIGKDARMVTDPHIAAVSAKSITTEDVAVGISYSGSSKDTVEVMKYATESGAVTIGITNFEKSPLTKYCDINLVCVARETTFRNESMASRIAQLSLVDILYTGVAIKMVGNSLEAIQRMQEVLQHKRI